MRTAHKQRIVYACACALKDLMCSAGLVKTNSQCNLSLYIYMQQKQAPHVHPHLSLQHLRQGAACSVTCPRYVKQLSAQFLFFFRLQEAR